MNTDTMTLGAFVENLRTYSEIAKRWHGLVWLCSLRTAMRLDRAEFDRLALAAHQADLIILSRADLVEAMDQRYLEESEIPCGTYSFHFLSEIL